jgi:antitoxin component YwqK of YwqJK toxin-antitoxin module
MKTKYILISLLFFFGNMAFAQNDIAANVPASQDVQVVEKYSDDGVLLFTAHVVNSKLHGEYTDYYEDGSVREKRDYKNGLLNGKSVRFFPDGDVMAEAEYENNVKVGTWIFVDRFAKQKVSVVYEDGQKKGVSYYKNGLCVDTVMY